MEWIKENAALIRDISATGFVLVLATVAVLTYLRAKETILQPLRSEIIKRQAQKMSDLLEFVADSQVSSGDKIDYIGLCSLNAFMWLEQYGFVTSNQDQLRKEYESVYDGFIQRVPPEGTIHDIEVPTPLSTPPDKAADKNVEEYRRLRYEKAKSGNLEETDIDKIFLTKLHQKYLTRLDAFARDPFLPSTTLKILKDFSESIHTNVAIILRTTIAEFLAATVPKFTKDSTVNPTINPLGVYNIFNHQRLNHASTLQLLRMNIRKHLKVDSTP